MTVLEIVCEYLADHGYDGIYSQGGECACLADDLDPCCEVMAKCRPGYRVPCDCGDHDWHIQEQKP